MGSPKKERIREDQQNIHLKVQQFFQICDRAEYFSATDQEALAAFQRLYEL